MTNPRKDKLCHNLWLTKEEADHLMEKLNNEGRTMGDLEIIGIQIEVAYKRGDFNKR